MLQTIVDDPGLNSPHQQLGNGGVHTSLKGCTDSPEASTMILMLVGTIGIYYGSQLFLRLSRQRATGSPAA